MTLEHHDFTETYNAIKVPGPVKSVDAKDPHLVDIEKQFFRSVQDSLDLSMRTLSYYFRYTSDMLVPRSRDEEFRNADDDVRIFRLRGGQALASAIYLRNEVNGRRGQITYFAKYDLHPETIETIHDLQELERIEFGIE